VHAALAASALAASVVPQRAQAAPNPCAITTFTVSSAICTGDQSAGISFGFYDNSFGPLYLTEVNSVFVLGGALTTNIHPATGAAGISILGASTTPFWLQMTDTQRTVTTNGDGAFGLGVRNLGTNLQDYFAGTATLINWSQVSTNGRNANVLWSASGVDLWESNFGHSTDAGGGNSAVVVNTGNLYSFSNAVDAYSHGIFAHSYSIYSQTGGLAQITSTAQVIETFGGHSNGIFGLSEGGFGESGDSGAGSGDSGNGGGIGGTVNITGGGNIYTYGTAADGILAISRGGKGGNGGNGTFGGGGGGAFGGRAGSVIVDGNWNITTYGANSSGIFAESLGGEGGSGGNSNIGIGDGGNGGGSGDGYTVTVHSRGHISTQGDFSYGVFGHSVGGFAGGGGNS
jgi:hypothetical protein